jgi:hypothetical protein
MGILKLVPNNAVVSQFESPHQSSHNQIFIAFRGFRLYYCRINTKNMEIVDKYDVQVEEWVLEPYEKHIGQGREEFAYIFGLTPRYPKELDCIFFNVGFQLKRINQIHGIVFNTRIVITFKIRNFGKAPTKEFLFELIELGMNECFNTFMDKSRGTLAQTYKIQKPTQMSVAGEIEHQIRLWNDYLEKTSLS